ncbi:MAG: sigma-70 family RNA polymerase sigma factor, partial [Clostridia bacterium]|nr:sigma-70 family RNA polymerase sigma factor [Clostridia bacterium]
MEVVKDTDNSRDQVLVQMVNQYQGMLLRMCYVYLRDMEQAKDATQETFLKAYKSLASFRGDCSEKSWLIRIAINTCRDMQRSAWFRYMDRRITPEDLPQAAFIPHEETDLDVMCDIMKLPPKLKEVIMLYYWQEMNVREIAQSLGIAQSTVSNRL